MPWEEEAGTATEATLQEIALSSGSLVPPLEVEDDYAGGEVLEDQMGGGAVLTFTFASPVQLVVVESSGALLVSRANPFGPEPDADTGIPCRDEVPTYMPVTTTVVKVYAPSGATVAVWGYRRA